jgi:hypothetical protein
MGRRRPLLIYKSIIRRVRYCYLYTIVTCVITPFKRNFLDSRKSHVFRSQYLITIILASLILINVFVTYSSCSYRLYALATNTTAAEATTKTKFNDTAARVTKDTSTSQLSFSFFSSYFSLFVRVPCFPSIYDHPLTITWS